MAGRSRTTKKLAQRIDLNYFKKLYPIPKWRRILSIGLTVLALGWAGWSGQRVFNAGPLARPHALLTNNCAACHSAEGKVVDRTCVACHDGPIHQARQTFTPACTGCHVEHQGAFRLAFTRDAGCTQCHANLKTKDGRVSVAKVVTSFEGGHPEFGPYRDPGTVKLNHQIHLKKDLRGAHGLVQLKCTECHQRQEASMLPIDYEKHCAECHPLQFDRRFAESVPHKKPEIVEAFLVEKFTAYIAEHPGEVHLADPADPRILRPPLPPAKNAEEWVARRVSDSEQLLWRKTCRECHATAPEIPKAEIPARWMKGASFDHESHQMLVCTECHSRAPNSQETSDVLLPGIQTCRQCHHGGRAAAEARCFECHGYHDWSKEKKIDGHVLIRQIGRE